MTLDAVEFLRRFLLHVLPKEFMRIRSYGFISNRNRKEKIALCRKLLGLPHKPSISIPETSGEEISGATDNDHSILCAVCRKGHVVEVETIRPDPTWALMLTCFLVHDTRWRKGMHMMQKRSPALQPCTASQKSCMSSDLC